MMTLMITMLFTNLLISIGSDFGLGEVVRSFYRFTVFTATVFV